MLIRSQDKKVLCNYNGGILEIREKYEHEIINLTMVPVGTGEYNIFFLCNGDEILIGTYSTAEKAINVLDMIENFYANLEYTKYAGSGYEEFLSVIFQMPKDAEVKV